MFTLFGSACSAAQSTAESVSHPNGELPGAPTTSEATATIHVAPDGDDEGSGTADSPYQTIARASLAAEPGVTVVVADGVYAGPFETRADGRADARISYVAERKWGAKLVTDEADVDADAVWRNYGDYVDIRGFDITGGTTDGLIQSGSNSRILENRVYGFIKGNCISTYSLNYTLSHIDIIGNVVHGCGASKLDHGIYPSYAVGKISNNISYGNAGFGIHCWHNCNQLNISNNLVFENATGGILVGQGDSPNFGSVAADWVIVANNIVINNGDRGIQEAGETGPNNRYLNNNVIGNTDDALSLITGTEAGTISENPEFEDYQPDGTGDYRLRTSSTMIDAGTPIGAPPTDIEGVPRPQGDQVDIGVYER